MAPDRRTRTAKVGFDPPTSTLATDLAQIGELLLGQAAKLANRTQIAAEMIAQLTEAGFVHLTNMADVLLMSTVSFCCLI